MKQKGAQHREQAMWSDFSTGTMILIPEPFASQRVASRTSSSSAWTEGVLLVTVSWKKDGAFSIHDCAELSVPESPEG